MTHTLCRKRGHRFCDNVVSRLQVRAMVQDIDQSVFCSLLSCLLSRVLIQGFLKRFRRASNLWTCRQIVLRPRLCGSKKVEKHCSCGFHISRKSAIALKNIFILKLFVLVVTTVFIICVYAIIILRISVTSKL